MINRFIIKRLQDEISQPQIDIILGPRQVGKTTLLKVLEKYCLQQGYNTGFFDLEQPDVLAEFNTSDKLVIDKIKSAGQVVFIDEFQYIANASKIFKAIVDSPQKVKIVGSGSSSLEIHKHLKESLAGRRFLFQIYPLQYSEIKAAANDYPFDDYLCYGGMPALTHTDQKPRQQQILMELLSSYILKDIKSLVREENIKAFNHLLYLLAEHQGSTISVHSLASQVNMSSKAVNHYLDILEETYVNFRVYSFSGNLGNELRKSTKTYLYDLGVRNAVLKDFSPVSERTDKGILLESFVFLKLKASLLPNMEIRFWRTKEGDEVDFVLMINRKPVPIEVKSRINSGEIPRGLRKFLSRYKAKTAFIVNETVTEETMLDDCRIRFITFEDFEKLAW
ncbi:MAG: ATP-binding protein [Sedimentisphaerales bacterium]|nr:ATP-binding protein [Sedimentisphaerales bacterium]